MLQWFIRFPEFTEFNESSALFRKNSNGFFTFQIGVLNGSSEYLVAYTHGAHAIGLFLLISKQAKTICRKIETTYHYYLRGIPRDLSWLFIDSTTGYQVVRTGQSR